ncbi:MAG: response regulator [Elusimicrobia bacterium]|nr:response regulator [Elusimicrobiota bacterium]
MKQRRDILVVDDEAVVTAAVARVCGQEGLSVDQAEGGPAGLAFLEAAEYRLVLCDVMMPGMDGFRFMAELEARGVRAPLVMATGYSTVENAVRALAQGAVDCLPKPFTAEELLAVVRRGLACGRLLSAAPGRPGADALPFVPCPARYHRLGRVAWASVEADGTALVGLDDLFLKSISGVRSIELSAVDEVLGQARDCAVVVAGDGTRHPVMAPLSGRVLRANAAADPVLVEKDPYFEGWLYRIVPQDLDLELGRLTPCSSDRA